MGIEVNMTFRPNYLSGFKETKHGSDANSTLKLIKDKVESCANKDNLWIDQNEKEGIVSLDCRNVPSMKDGSVRYQHLKYKEDKNENIKSAQLFEEDAGSIMNKYTIETKKDGTVYRHEQHSPGHWGEKDSKWAKTIKENKDGTLTYTYETFTEPE